MQHKKILIGALVLALALGGTYAYSSGEMLQGKFGGVSVKTTTPVKGTGSSTAKPDFYFSGGVSYDSGNNYFKVKVCQTNVTSSDVKQTSLKFSVAGGQNNTVQFTPTVAGSSELCQTVYSGDLSSKLMIYQSGNYDVTATLDTTSVQTEASESNNTVTTTGVVTASSYYLYDAANLPDLTLDDMYVQVLSGGTVFSGARVCGVDEILSFQSHDIRFYFTLSQNGDLISSNTTTELGSELLPYTYPCIQVGYYLSTSEVAQLVSGEITLTTQIDTMDAIVEADEDNNGFYQSFTEEIVME